MNGDNTLPGIDKIKRLCLLQVLFLVDFKNSEKLSLLVQNDSLTNEVKS